jgi:hypothetical protein
MTTVQVYPGQSWVCPAGITGVTVIICGAGGGGAGGGTSSPGLGGHAGSVIGPFGAGVTPGQSYPVTGGSYGAGGVPVGGLGGDGGAVTFMGTTAQGGQGGQGAAPEGGSGCGGGSTNVGSGDAQTVACSAGVGLGGGGSGGTAVSLGGLTGGHGSTGGVIITYVVLTPSITPTPPSGPAPLNVSFTGNVSGGTATTYDWNYGDGSAHGSTQNPTHQYTVVGAKTVTFTVTNSYGSWTATATVTVYWTPSAHAFVISTEPWRR